MPGKKKKAAHFLLLPELANSPPNEAIVHALLEQDYDVDLYAPGAAFDTVSYGPRVNAYPVEYGRRWLIKNALSRRWRDYSVFSGTSEDPLAVVGTLAFLHNRPSFVLVDEIKSGSYYGDSPEYWKRLCRWAIRRARFSIVNDLSRIALLRDYAVLDSRHNVVVYPGSYFAPPTAASRANLRKYWSMPEDAFIIGASGGFNLTSGTDWLIEALQHIPYLHAVIQPLAIEPLTRILLRNLACGDRIFVEQSRLGWKEAWSSAAAFDVGLAVYTNPAPQFQNMGISSNRLCMYLAMGVPVIASRQPSFNFLETYKCGVLVGSQQEFNDAIKFVRDNLTEMKANALRCSNEYVDAAGKLQGLHEAFRGIRR